MSNEQELNMWKSLLSELNSIPENYRSRNHTEYLREVEGRVYECSEAQSYINSKEK